jgi:hypothetical protein
MILALALAVLALLSLAAPMLSRAVLGVRLLYAGSALACWAASVGLLADLACTSRVGSSNKPAITTGLSTVCIFLIGILIL